MCGVCGFFAVPTASIGPVQLDRMVDSMVHRGPDDRGVFYSNWAGIGFRRLSILDVAGGHQPMSSEDGSIRSVVNGEIYNYAELRDQAMKKGHRFYSSSDAEVIPHLYEDGGIEAVVRQLRGMYAVAIVDQAHETLHLVRDHFGIKPLYYAETAHGLIFASDIRSLIASGLISPKLSPQALWHYLTFQYVPEPYTMFDKVWKLPPGHYLTYHAGTKQVVRYWQVEYRPDSSWTLPALTEAIYRTLKDSVKRHMMSDVPRGAYLSSGVDSSAVVAFLRQQQEVDTFSIGFPGDHGEINELVASRETARILGTRHHEVVISPEEYLDHLPQIVKAQEDPIADPSAPALYFLAREARRHVTVVLSGEGADELFGGYPIYREPYALKPFEYLPHPIRQQLGDFAKKLPPQLKGRGYLIRGSQRLEDRYIGNAKMFSEGEKGRLVPWLAEMDLDPYQAITAPYFAATTGLDPVARLQTIDAHTWLPGDILMKADKMSMAHSLELRVPFLDLEVFSLAATIPAHFKIAKNTTKYALRQAMKAVLPPEVSERPKLGFPIPIRHWLKTTMYDFVRDVLAKDNTPFFDASSVQSLLTAPEGTVFNRDRKIWTLMIFALWHEQYLTPSGCSDFGVTQEDMSHVTKT